MRFTVGSSVGTTALEVDVARAPLISGSVTIDDNGNTYTGQDRLTAAFNLANLTGHGDQLDLRHPRLSTRRSAR
jgi:hemolysin activation/secretion protein